MNDSKTPDVAAAFKVIGEALTKASEEAAWKMAAFNAAAKPDVMEWTADGDVPAGSHP